MRRTYPRQKGTATIVVLWCVAIAAVIVAATQLVTWRTAVLGRSSLARIQARWAARAGIEQMISTLAYYSEFPEEGDPMAIFRELEKDCVGELSTGSWDIRHVSEGEEYQGPLDEHSRLNLENINPLQYAEFENMGPDTIDAINDWVDEDKEGKENGPMMWQKILEVDNIQEKFQAFLDVSDNKGSRLYEILDEYSNMTEYFQLSIEEQQEYKYRRIVLYDLTSAGEQAFLANQKTWMEADKKLGVDYMYALLKPVFATDSDFMLVLLDKSRFDYHKNWSDRMDKRFSDPGFNENYENIQESPVSTVVDEWNLNLLEEYIY